MLFLLLACDSPAAPLSPSAPASPEAPEAPAAPSAPAPAWQVPAVESHTKLTDGFTFWGWSSDSSHYAYSLLSPSSGGVECDATASLIVVDATTDAYATGGVHRFAWPHPEGPCEGLSPQEQLDAARPAVLARFGIEVGAPVLLNSEGVTDWVLTPPAGPHFGLTLVVTDDDPDDDALGYQLTLRELGHAGKPVIVEDGSRQRDFTYDYTPAAVVLAPDGQHIAVIITMTVQSYEGTRTTWMTNGATLPTP